MFMGNRRRGVSASALAVALMAAGAAWSQEKLKETAPPPEPAANPRLLQVKRVCVQNFGDDALGVQVREMVIAKLFESKRFSLTENCEKAEFALKGTVIEKGEFSQRGEQEGASGIGGERLYSTDQKKHATVTLRLVDKDGEILWASSQESTGGKTKGAIADAADRAVRKFLRDIERAEKQNSASPAKP